MYVWCAFFLYHAIKNERKMTALFYTYMDSPIGRLLMLSDGEHLTNLDCELEQTTPIFEKVRSALMRYFNGEPESFSNIPLSPKGTAFQQAIWTALRQIPYGKTVSYGGLAESINNPKAVRAVGGAVGSNPISIIIPCHRVLGKKCEITGFGGGLPAKRFLLKLENIPYIDKGVEYVKPKLLKKYHE